MTDQQRQEFEAVTRPVIEVDMANDIKDMAQFLPPRVRIAKTPEFRWQQTTDITVEVVDLKTEDVIAAFLSMQQQAIGEAGKIREARRRNEAIRRIRAMTHFMPDAGGLVDRRVRHRRQQ